MLLACQEEVEGQQWVEECNVGLFVSAANPETTPYNYPADSLCEAVVVVYAWPESSPGCASAWQAAEMWSFIAGPCVAVDLCRSALCVVLRRFSVRCCWLFVVSVFSS